MASNRRFKSAIDKGQVEVVRELLTADPGLAVSPVRWGPTFQRCETEPLHYLSDGPFNQLWDHGRQAEMAKVLIAAGAPVDGVPTSGETPLHGAASLGEAGVAEVLIDNGANVEAVATYPGIPDGTPLDFAVHFGMTEVVDLLVRRGARVLSPRMAAGAGQLDRVQAEIEAIQQNTDRFLDVFRVAAVCDRTEVVEFLLANEMDINADIDGATVLHWAAWEAKPKMVEYLLEHGASAQNLDRKYQLTPHGWAEHRRKELGPRWGHDKVMLALQSANSE